MELSFVPSSDKDDNYKETYKDLCENGAVRDSPESGSLYSDYESGQQYEQDLPSGYNSGEQYDTISTGYMSGEAYELPEARAERMEPTLSIIQEMGGQASGGSQGGGDEDIFTIAIPAPPASFPENQLLVQADLMDVSSSSSSSIPENLEMAQPMDPNTAHKVKRKKQVSYCVSVPMDTSPLGGAILNYRELPSDTDTTSCVDSDGTYMRSELQSSDSGAALLNHSSTRKKKATTLHEASEPGIIKGSRKRTTKKRKTNRRHDEFFLAHDSKYWEVARKALFWLSILSIMACIAVAVAMIILMPRKCDPLRSWWQGHVMLEVIPTDGSLRQPTIDLHDLITEVPHLAKTGFQTIKLKNLYLRDLEQEPGLNSSDWYDCDDRTFFKHRFDDETLLGDLVKQVHRHNMTMMVEIPAIEKTAGRHNMSMVLKQAVSRSIKYWAELGMDGISLVGVEQFGQDHWIVDDSNDWKVTLEKYGTSSNEKILTTSYLLAQRLADNIGGANGTVNFALLDATVSLESLYPAFNSSQLSADVETAAKWDKAPSRPWINWNVKTGNISLNNAELAFHLFLPGTVTLPSSALNSFNNSSGDVDWVLSRLLKIRASAVPVHMNGNYRNCIGDCSNVENKETNHKISKTTNNLLLLERHFNRRNRYMVISNMNEQEANLSTISTYSGGEVILDTSLTTQNNHYVNFKDTKIEGNQAFVIKFPK